MKTLIQSTIWVPDPTSDRFQTVEKHLAKLQEAEGEFDIYLVDNNSCPEFKEVLSKLPAKFQIDYLSENRGWNYARNLGFKKAHDEDYQVLILMDCDIWVEDPQWVEKSKAASLEVPAFMVRFHEARYKLSDWTTPNGTHFEIYDEGIGSINVISREAILKVGGYDTTVFPNKWGFTDCHLFRRYLKAGYFKGMKGYPSLPLNAVNGQDFEKSYNKILNPIKDQEAEKWFRVFRKDEEKILMGLKPVFFNWEETFR